ncbi:MarR family winged helix-turn-helix transcriptional regulator [Seonamhaeicola marinus]|uniref:Winged helix-turn-helix transcriptional regulator n=1 Tax=Seonamhaeicola marinus TaxID=1912246 RepID=A0A5D0HIY7_9FLAO|nr:MarR family winged helix-turn-helix transcriptional regulator [Seonamhaeicola marinus]TYA71364.1 winged helix-turn-helix transcriptional regulator [Seonamhaeicola marinus]
MDRTKTYPNIKEDFNPKDCISGKVMRCNRIIANVFRQYLAPFNITDSQLSMLFVLSKVKTCNQKTISDILFLEKSTVHRNINRLVQTNIVTVLGTKELELTDNGWQLLNDIMPAWEKAMEEIKETIGSDGVNALNVLTSKLEH